MFSLAKPSFQTPFSEGGALTRARFTEGKPFDKNEIEMSVAFSHAFSNRFATESSML